MSPWIAPAWFGEFGWEVMSWAPWCRARSRECGGAIITSFGASRALYADFATRFRDHGGTDRSLSYPKEFGMYRSHGPDFEHVRYGNRTPGQSGQSGQQGPILIHARGIPRKAAINYASWPAVLARLAAAGLAPLACIGTAADGHLPGTVDLRGLPLDRLMDLLASAAVAVGCSSGTLHLAAACGCALVVWGDTKTRYDETLERRYRETWNPHHVDVTWLDADDWQPDPSRVAAAIERLLPRQPGQHGQ